MLIYPMAFTFLVCLCYNNVFAIHIFTHIYAWISWVQKDVKHFYLVLIVSCQQTQPLPAKYNDHFKVYSLMVPLMT